MTFEEGFRIGSTAGTQTQHSHSALPLSLPEELTQRRQPVETVAEHLGRRDDGTARNAPGTPQTPRRSIPPPARRRGSAAACGRTPAADEVVLQDVHTWYAPGRAAPGRGRKVATPTAASMMVMTHRQVGGRLRDDRQHPPEQPGWGCPPPHRERHRRPLPQVDEQVTSRYPTPPTPSGRARRARRASPTGAGHLEQLALGTASPRRAGTRTSSVTSMNPITTVVVAPKKLPGGPGRPHPPPPRRPPAPALAGNRREPRGARARGPFRPATVPSFSRAVAIVRGASFRKVCSGAAKASTAPATGRSDATITSEAASEVGTFTRSSIRTTGAQQRGEHGRERDGTTRGALVQPGRDRAQRQQHERHRATLSPRRGGARGPRLRGISLPLGAVRDGRPLPPPPCAIRGPPRAFDGFRDERGTVELSAGCPYIRRPAPHR